MSVDIANTVHGNGPRIPGAAKTFGVYRYRELPKDGIVRAQFSLTQQPRQADFATAGALNSH